MNQDSSVWVSWLSLLGFYLDSSMSSSDTSSRDSTSTHNYLRAPSSKLGMAPSRSRCILNSHTPRLQIPAVQGLSLLH